MPHTSLRSWSGRESVVDEFGLHPMPERTLETHRRKIDLAFDEGEQVLVETIFVCCCQSMRRTFIDLEFRVRD